MSRQQNMKSLIKIIKIPYHILLLYLPVLLTMIKLLFLKCHSSTEKYICLM